MKQKATEKVVTQVFWRRPKYIDVVTKEQQNRKFRVGFRNR